MMQMKENKMTDLGTPNYQLVVAVTENGHGFWNKPSIDIVTQIGCYF